MKKIEEASRLAEKMIAIGEKNGRRVYAAVTNMDQPLGRAVGNALEVQEAIDTLKGNGPEDFTELCYIIGSLMLVAGEKADNAEKARAMLEKSVKSGEALEKFRRFVENQGGDPNITENSALLPSAKVKKTVYSPANGVVTAINGEMIGAAAVGVKAGRLVKTDKIDFGSGFVLLAKIGDKAVKGQPIAEIHAPDEKTAEEASHKLEEAYSFGDKGQSGAGKRLLSLLGLQSGSGGADLRRRCLYRLQHRKRELRRYQLCGKNGGVQSGERRSPKNNRRCNLYR